MKERAENVIIGELPLLKLDIIYPVSLTRTFLASVINFAPSKKEINLVETK